MNINGYKSITGTKSPFYDQYTTFTQIPLSFDSFQNNEVILIQGDRATLNRKREFSLQGLDAELTFSLLKKGIFRLEAGAGPYFYFGSYKNHAYGAKVDLALNISSYFSIRGGGSYDNLYHARGQGELAFTFSFGPGAKNCSQNDRPDLSFTDAKLLCGQKRREIIPTKDVKKTKLLFDTITTFSAINPDTNQPYHVLFVDNQVSSELSKTSNHLLGQNNVIYPSILQAINNSSTNDIIYIYPGDGTSQGLTATGSPFAPLDYQKFWGSSTAQELTTTLGIITIPPSTVGLPQIASNGNTIFTAANGMEFSGLHFSSYNYAINTPGISIKTGLVVKNSVFVNSLNNNSIASRFSGDVILKNNSFISSGGVVLAFIAKQSQNCNYSILQNTFNLSNTSGGLVLQTEAFTGSLDFLFESNVVVGSGAIRAISFLAPQKLNAIVSNNDFSGSFLGDPVILSFGVSFDSNLRKISFINNNFNTANRALQIESPQTPERQCISLLNNVSTAGSNAYYFNAESGGVLNYETTDPGFIPTNTPNTFTGSGATPVAPGTCGFP